MLPTTDLATGLAVSDSLLILANNYAGYQMYDLARPDSPAELHETA